MNGNEETMLNRVTPDNISLEIKDPVDPKALEQTKAIMEELGVKQTIKQAALLKVAQRLGDVPSDSNSLVVSKEECKAAFDGLSQEERTSLTNIYSRVKAFADAQRRSVTDMEISIPGGKAGHNVSPCKGKIQIV